MKESEETLTKDAEEKALVSLSVALTEYFTKTLTRSACEHCGCSAATPQDIRNALSHLKGNGITFESIEAAPLGPALIESMQDLMVTSEDLGKQLQLHGKRRAV